jgi:hypothetical protein
MTFHEYPKWVRPEGKPELIVHSRDEEERVLGITSAAEIVDLKINVPSAEPEPEAPETAMKNALMRAAAQARGKRK